MAKSAKKTAKKAAKKVAKKATKKVAAKKTAKTAAKKATTPRKKAVPVVPVDKPTDSQVPATPVAKTYGGSALESKTY